MIGNGAQWYHRSVCDVQLSCGVYSIRLNTVLCPMSVQKSLGECARTLCECDHDDQCDGRLHTSIVTSVGENVNLCVSGIQP